MVLNPKAAPCPKMIAANVAVEKGTKAVISPIFYLFVELNELNVELGPRGFTALGVVFDPPNAPESHGELVGPAVTFFKLTYPVGYSSKAEVDTYLGRQRNQVLIIPQIVLIDHAGMIRAASGGAGGDPRLEDENNLRRLIEELLK